MLWFIRDVCVWTGSHPNTEDTEHKDAWCQSAMLGFRYVCMYVRAVVYKVCVCLSICNVCVNVYAGAFWLCIYVKKMESCQVVL